MMSIRGVNATLPGQVKTGPATEIKFKLYSDTPTTVTLDVTNITTNSALAACNIIDLNGATGTCTLRNKSTGALVASWTIGADHPLTGLSPSTTYTLAVMGTKNILNADNTVSPVSVQELRDFTTNVPPNTPPVANPDTSTTAYNTPVTMNVLANDTDANGDTLTITGTPTATNGTVVKNGNNTLTFTPTSGFSGTAVVTYTISDGNGGNATSTWTITVDAAANILPVPTFTGFTTDASLSMNYSGQLTATDANGDALTYALQTAPSVGTLVVNPNGSFTFTGSVMPGSYSFIYTVKDAGTPVAKTATITINDVAPVAGGAFASLGNMTVSDQAGAGTITVNA